MGGHDVDDDRPTGLVLTAGGARGAYQAGALAELLPALHAAGAVPRVLVGESVGAINAAVLASVAHLTPQAQGDALVAHWSTASKGNVLRPLWRQLPTVALRYGGETIGVPGLALRGLLSVTPLRRTLERDIDWRRVRANVTTGALSAVAVTATAVTTGRSVTFVDGTADRLPPDGDNLTYRGARIGVDHVVGSGAIPALFPPAWIDEPTAAAGWYVDGCTRLHTPLRPALDLGVGRLAVVGTTSLRWPRARSTSATRR
jgi:NTE family protein